MEKLIKTLRALGRGATAVPASSTGRKKMKRILVLAAIAAPASADAAPKRLFEARIGEPALDPRRPRRKQDVEVNAADYFLSTVSVPSPSEVLRVSGQRREADARRRRTLGRGPCPRTDPTRLCALFGADPSSS